MNVSVPDALKSFVDEQVEARGYGTASDYVQDLIRKDLERQRLRGLLLAGAASEPSAAADPTFLEELRASVHRRARE